MKQQRERRDRSPGRDGATRSRYSWSAGYHGRRGVSPQAVAERLSDLARESAHRLTPRQVVDDARDPEAVLHPCFEWDDLRAAELHREHQARHVISSLRVIEPATTPEIQRVYVSVEERRGEDTERSYRPLSVVRADPVQRDAVLAEARRGLEAWRARYTGLIDATTIRSLVDEVAAEWQPDAERVRVSGLDGATT